MPQDTVAEPVVKYTPGPWAVHSVFRSYVVCASDVEKSIGGSSDPDREAADFAKEIHRGEASLYPEFYRSRIVSRDEVEANARLIAAAPDLLDALKTAVSTIRALHGIGLSAKHEPHMWALYQSSPEMTFINAAVAKAEGRA